MSRNKDRLGGVQDTNTGAIPPMTQNSNNGGELFSFVVPTDFVELPSKGKYYAEGHPLCNQETIEVRHMTAKEEDILTSRALLKKGIALDRVIQNLIIDQTVDANSLLVGDRNAVVIAARISAYGAEYNTKVTCPSCSATQEYSFDLHGTETHYGEDLETMEIEDNLDGTFNIELPVTKVNATFKLLRGVDERALLNRIQAERKGKKGLENNITRQLSSILIAVNGDSSPEAKKYLIENIPSLDSRHLRFAHKCATPNIELAQEFECSECDFVQEMEVPLTADFFWPDR